jgi:hypothetical protein
LHDGLGWIKKKEGNNVAAASSGWPYQFSGDVRNGDWRRQIPLPLATGTWSNEKTSGTVAVLICFLLPGSIELALLAPHMGINKATCINPIS